MEFIALFLGICVLSHGVWLALRIKYPELYRELAAGRLDRKRRWTRAATRRGTPLAVKLLEHLLRR